MWRIAGDFCAKSCHNDRAADGSWISDAPVEPSLLRRVHQQQFDLALPEMPGRGAEHFLEVLAAARRAGIASDLGPTPEVFRLPEETPDRDFRAADSEFSTPQGNFSCALYNSASGRDRHT
jgi:hypothetical protein